MSKSYEDDYESSSSSRNSDSAGLLNSEDVNKEFPLVVPRKSWVTLSRVHLAALYAVLLVFTLQALRTWVSKPVDISLGNLYSKFTSLLDCLILSKETNYLVAPAKEVIEYEEKEFTWNFWDKGQYMGFPTDEKDKMWSDLYNCISPFSAQRYALSLTLGQSGHPESQTKKQSTSHIQQSQSQIPKINP